MCGNAFEVCVRFSVLFFIRVCFLALFSPPYCLYPNFALSIAKCGHVQVMKSLES